MRNVILVNINSDNGDGTYEVREATADGTEIGDTDFTATLVAPEGGTPSPIPSTKPYLAVMDAGDPPSLCLPFKSMVGTLFDDWCYVDAANPTTNYNGGNPEFGLSTAKIALLHFTSPITINDSTGSYDSISLGGGAGFFTSTVGGGNVTLFSYTAPANTTFSIDTYITIQAKFIDADFDPATVVWNDKPAFASGGAAMEMGEAKIKASRTFAPGSAGSGAGLYSHDGPIAMRGRLSGITGVDGYSGMTLYGVGFYHQVERETLVAASVQAAPAFELRNIGQAAAIYTGALEL